MVIAAAVDTGLGPAVGVGTDGGGGYVVAAVAVKTGLGPAVGVGTSGVGGRAVAAAVGGGAGAVPTNISCASVGAGGA